MQCRSLVLYLSFKLDRLHCTSLACKTPLKVISGADPGEVKWVNFHPRFSEPPSFVLFFSYPSNIEIKFDFSDIITKIHPPFQNPGSTLGSKGIWYHIWFIRTFSWVHNFADINSNRQVQKSDRTNSDRQSRSDRLGSTRIVSDHEKT